MHAYIEYLGTSILSRSSGNFSQNHLSATQASVEMFSFYIAVGLLSKEEQIGSYTMFMQRVHDDTIQDQVLQINEKHYQKHMLEQLYHCRIMVGTYGEDQRKNYF